MIKSVVQKIILWSAPVILMGSCMDDAVEIKDLKYSEPLNLAAPIGSIDLSAKDLLEQLDSTSYFYADDEGLLHFQYDTSFSAVWEDLIEFSDLSLTQEYDINPNKKEQVGPFVDTIVINLFSFGEDNQRFDSLLIESALMAFSVSLPADFEGSYTVSIPEILMGNGNSVSFNRNFDDNTPIEPAILDGGKIILQNLNGKSFITIHTSVDVTNVTGTPSNTNMTLEVAIQSLNPNEIFGYFGKINVFEQKQEIALDFFNTFDFSDLVEFKDITMEVSINNYFGIPLGLYIDSLIFENTTSGEFENIVINDNSIEVEPATYGDPVVPSVNKITVNRENSNLIDGINLGPDRFYVEVRGLVNPHGETSQNFLNTATKIEGNALIDLPFWFKTSLYQRTDTMDFNLVEKFSDSTQIDMVEELNMELYFTNGFPFNIQAQIYMADANFKKIDSLFDTSGGAFIWESAEVDGDGKVISPTSTEVRIQLLNEKVKKFYDQKAMYILIKSSVSTGDKEDPEFVKLYEDYSIAGRMNFEIKSGEITY